MLPRQPPPVPMEVPAPAAQAVALDRAPIPVVLPEASPAGQVPEAAPEASYSGANVGHENEHPSENVVISTHLQNFLINLADVLPGLVSVKARVRACEFGNSSVIPKILIDMDLEDSWLAEPPRFKLCGPVVRASSILYVM